MAEDQRNARIFGVLFLITFVINLTADVIVRGIRKS